MIDVHFWTTPNGYKILLALEEATILIQTWLKLSGDICFRYPD